MSAQIEAAFASDQALKSRIINAIQSKELAVLFQDISLYILNQSNNSNSRKRTHDEDDAPAVKKTKVTNGAQSAGAGDRASSQWMTEGATAFTAQDISFQVPLRKKLRLELVEDGGVRVKNPASDQVELGMAWSDIEQVILVAAPEKATPSYNFVVIPRTVSQSQPLPEALVFNVAPKPPKDMTLDHGDTYEAYIKRDFNSHLTRYQKQIVEPTAEEFESKMVQGRRKGERLWHVKAHRGSKDGYLYFLSTGILFAFRKPVLFFPFDAIMSISYSSVLQRTFNLNINASTTEGGEAEEIEFSMIDQADFEGIDTYIKRHGLNDASLADSRRAKRFNVNKVKGEPTEGDAVGEEDGVQETELEKARRLERELQDEEDEEEEDYVVSGGESEGSGGESDDDGDGGDEGGGDVEAEDEDDDGVGGDEDEEEEEEE